MKVTKITIALNYFILAIVTAFCWADPVLVGSTAEPENTRSHYALRNTINKNITDITLSGEMLKRTADGKVMLNIGGSDTDQGDDFRRMPRPFFDGEHLTGLVSIEKIEKAMTELLDYINWLLEKPTGELDESQLASAVNELETLDEARAREKKKDEFDPHELLSSMPEAEQVRFTHHPGYQESHPAHPSADQTYTVPGMLMAAGGKKGSQEASQAGREPASKKRVKKRQRLDDAGASDGSGGNGGRSKKPKLSSEATAVTLSEYFERTVEQDEQSRTFQCEITDDNRDLKCLICCDLVRLKNNKARVCDACQNHQCIDCVSQQSTPDKCSQCKVHFTTVALNLRISRLKWQCSTCYQDGITIPDMEAHAANCGAIESCSNEGCDFSGTHADLEAHDSECRYRMVLIGNLQFPYWQKELIESQAAPIPDGFGGDDDPENPAGVAVALLLGKITSEAGSSGAESQSLWQNCPGCHLPVEYESLEEHLAICGKMTVICDCGTSLLREDLGMHERTECANFKPCRFCDEVYLLTDLFDHFDECKHRRVTCEINGCDIRMRAFKLQAHSDECAKRAVKCKICRMKYLPRSFKRHKRVCAHTFAFNGEIFFRQVCPASVPVYHEAIEKSIICIFIPTDVLRNRKRFKISSVDTSEGCLSNLKFTEAWSFYGEAVDTVRFTAHFFDMQHHQNLFQIHPLHNDRHRPYITLNVSTMTSGGRIYPQDVSKLPDDYWVILRLTFVDEDGNIKTPLLSD